MRRSGRTWSDGAACFTSDGLYCAAQGTCAALAAVDAPCSQTEPCADGAYCDEASCRNQLALGAACNTAVECMSGGCTGACVAGELASPDLCSGNINFN